MLKLLTCVVLFKWQLMIFKWIKNFYFSVIFYFIADDYKAPVAKKKIGAELKISIVMTNNQGSKCFFFLCFPFSLNFFNKLIVWLLTSEIFLRCGVWGWRWIKFWRKIKAKLIEGGKKHSIFFHSSSMQRHNFLE